MTQQSSAPESVATILFPSKEEMLFCYGVLLFAFSAKFDHVLCPLHPATIFVPTPPFMNGIGGSSNNPPGKKGTELERLMKQHEEKQQRKQELMLRRQELKRQIEKHNLEKQKNRESTTEEGKQVFKQLSEEYNSLREEYNELLTQRTSREH
ncbi:hypothetical protein ACOSP7_017078 [Xanthoceras sorbifolium]